MSTHEGYKKVSLNFSFCKLLNVGDTVRGKYLGIKKVPVEGVEKDYIQIQISETESVGLPVNKSLREGFTNVAVGSSILIELVETIDTGQPAPFKRYEVYLAEGELPVF